MGPHYLDEIKGLRVGPLASLMSRMDLENLEKKHWRSYAFHAKIVDIYVFIALHY